MGERDGNGGEGGGVDRGPGVEPLGGCGETSGGSWKGRLGSLGVVFGVPKAPGGALGLLGLEPGTPAGFGEPRHLGALCCPVSHVWDPRVGVWGGGGGGGPWGLTIPRELGCEGPQKTPH